MASGRGRKGRVIIAILLFSLFAGQLVHLVLGPGLAKEGLGDGGGGHHVRPPPAVKSQCGGAVQALQIQRQIKIQKYKYM